MLTRKEEKRSIFTGISLRKNKDRIPFVDASIEKEEEKAIKVKEINYKKPSFCVPTKSAKQMPIFYFQFEELNQDLNMNFHVMLNPDLVKNTESFLTKKQFALNNNGFCQFNYEFFNQYFIDGSIQIEPNNIPFAKKVEINLAYGNDTGSLNTICGMVQLEYADD